MVPDHAVTRLAAKAMRAFGPVSRAHLAVLDQKTMRKREDKEENGLRNRPHHAAGRDVDGNAVLRACIQIHVVVADSAAADGAEARDSFKRRRGNLRLERNEYVVAFELRRQILGSILAQKLVRDSGNTVQQRQSDVGERKRPIFPAEIRREADAEACCRPGLTALMQYAPAPQPNPER